MRDIDLCVSHDAIRIRVVMDEYGSMREADWRRLFISAKGHIDYVSNTWLKSDLRAGQCTVGEWSLYYKLDIVIKQCLLVTAWLLLILLGVQLHLTVTCKTSYVMRLRQMVV